MKIKNKNNKFGIIGLGRMGRCLVQGLLESGAYEKEQILFTTKHSQTAERVRAELGIFPAKNNRELVGECQTVVLSVKPQNVTEVLSETKGSFKSDCLLVSIVASIPTSAIESQLGGKTAVIRGMPNTPVFVREGMTALCPGKFATKEQLAAAIEIFRPLGRVLKTDEKNLNAVTGLSGCGPAYIYLILESLTEAGIKVGLPRDVATELSAQTVLGSAKMLLQTGRHPASLKDEVTTPAGCTIDGILELEEGKLRVTLIKAVVQATKRARILAKNAK